MQTYGVCNSCLRSRSTPQWYFEVLSVPPITFLQKKDPDVRSWSPRESSNVSRTDVKLETEADALATGLPIDCSVKVQYSTSTDFGAVLMCDDQVVAEGFDHRQPFLKWIKTNAKALLKQFPDVKEYGITAVTWTYSASNIYINSWEDPKKEIVLVFKVGATGVGSLKPEWTWARSRLSTGWSKFDDQKRFVFFTGVKIRFRWFGRRGQRESHWRGSGDDFLADLGDGEAAEAEVECIGDSWEDILEDEEE